MGKDPRFGWRLSFVAVGGAEAHDGGAVKISAGTVKNNASGSGGVAGIAIGAGGGTFE